MDRRTRAGWIRFRRCTRGLYDQPEGKASLLLLKARMVKSKPVETLLYICATRTPLKDHNKIRTLRILLRILEARCKSSNTSIRSYNDGVQRVGCETIEPTVRTRKLLWSGALLRMGDHMLPKSIMSGELENVGQRGPEGSRNIMDGLRGRGSSGVMHHGGLK